MSRAPRAPLRGFHSADHGLRAAQQPREGSSKVREGPVTCSQRQPIKVNWPPVDEKPLEAETTVGPRRGLCLPLCLRPALLPADTCPALTNELMPQREEATGGGHKPPRSTFS